MKKKFDVMVTVTYDVSYEVEVDVDEDDIGNAEDLAKSEAEMRASEEFAGYDIPYFADSIEAWCCNEENGDDE